MVNSIMKKFPEIPKEDIYQVFIFSRDEYEETISKVSNIPIEQKCAWWLRSVDGTKNYAAVHYVDQQGRVCSTGPDIHSFAIRPAFRCHNMCTYKPGDKVTLGTLICTVVDAVTVLCDDIMGHVHFGKSKNYWNSNIREIIEDPKLLTRIYCF